MIRYIALILGGILAVTTVRAAEAARLVKVLPHYLDSKGRNTLSPSLFERDAYQEFLRKHPGSRAALRFDVQCKGIHSGAAAWKLRLEIRGAQGGAANPLVIERMVSPGGLLGTWVPITLEGEDFRKCGEVGAWRATLWLDGQTQPVSELKSFLW